MGLEPTTISLATRCSTTELRPLGCMQLIYTTSRIMQVHFEKKSVFFAIFSFLYVLPVEITLKPGGFYIIFLQKWKSRGFFSCFIGWYRKRKNAFLKLGTEINLPLLFLMVMVQSLRPGNLGLKEIITGIFFSMAGLTPDMRLLIAVITRTVLICLLPCGMIHSLLNHTVSFRKTSGK